MKAGQNPVTNFEGYSMINFIAFVGGVLLAAFLSTAQAAEVAASVKITDRPSYVAAIDYHQMEEVAEKKWKEVLPKLQKNLNDYHQAWTRLKGRHKEVLSAWSGVANQGMSNSRAWEDAHDMRSWCANVGFWDVFDMEKLKKDIAQEFARLDVRTQVCEDALPKQASKKK